MPPPAHPPRSEVRAANPPEDATRVAPDDLDEDTALRGPGRRVGALPPPRSPIRDTQLGLGAPIPAGPSTRPAPPLGSIGGSGPRESRRPIADTRAFEAARTPLPGRGSLPAPAPVPLPAPLPGTAGAVAPPGSLPPPAPLPAPGPLPLRALATPLPSHPPAAPPEPARQADLGLGDALRELGSTTAAGGAAQPLDVSTLARGSLAPGSEPEPAPESKLARLLEPSQHDLSPTAGALEIGPFLQQRVRLGRGALPVPALLAICAAAAALLFGIVTFLLGTVIGPPRAEVASVGTAAASTTAEPSAVTTEASAAQDEPTRTSAPAKPADPDSPEGILASARGRTERKHREVAELGQSLKQQPSGLDQAATRKRLLAFADDPATTVQALTIMAGLPGPIAADLLYEVWTGTPARNEATELAEALVYTERLRAAASPALAVALEMRRAESCEQHLALIPRAREHGDRRSMHLLARLMRRHGCGPRKTGDCYKCLRDNDELKDALKAVRSRPEPKLR